MQSTHELRVLIRNAQLTNQTDTILIDIFIIIIVSLISFVRPIHSNLFFYSIFASFFLPRTIQLLLRLPAIFFISFSFLFGNVALLIAIIPIGLRRIQLAVCSVREVKVRKTIVALFIFVFSFNVVLCIVEIIDIDALSMCALCCDRMGAEGIECMKRGEMKHRKQEYHLIHIRRSVS